jgi:hypothetical protein
LPESQCVQAFLRYVKYYRWLSSRYGFVLQRECYTQQVIVGRQHNARNPHRHHIDQLLRMRRRLPFSLRDGMKARSTMLEEGQACIENLHWLAGLWNSASIQGQRRSYRGELTGTGSHSQQESNSIANSSLESMQRCNAIPPECSAKSVHTQVNWSPILARASSKSPWCAWQDLSRPCLAMLMFQP